MRNTSDSHPGIDPNHHIRCWLLVFSGSAPWRTEFVPRDLVNPNTLYNRALYKMQMH